MPRRYFCVRAATTPALNGQIDDPCWSAAPWSEEFVDIEGASKPHPPFKTRMKMLWDDGFLYVAAEVEEPHVWATLSKKNSVIFQDNDFEIFIDPDGDTLNYYEFEINALGTIWELMLPRPYRFGGVPVNPWNVSGLRSAVFVDGALNEPGVICRGWSVEVAIPFAGLAELWNKARPEVGDEWRINFSRVQWDLEEAQGAFRKIPDRPEHNWVWSPQGVVDMHRPEMWGSVQFVG